MGWRDGKPVREKTISFYGLQLFMGLLQFVSINPIGDNLKKILQHSQIFKGQNFIVDSRNPPK